MTKYRVFYRDGFWFFCDNEEPYYLITMQLTLEALFKQAAYCLEWTKL